MAPHVLAVHPSRPLALHNELTLAGRAPLEFSFPGSLPGAGSWVEWQLDWSLLLHHVIPSLHGPF